jgi:conjugal transfer pilus assembly protein TraW
MALLALLMGIIMCSPAYARVVGREGVTYPIREKDMLEVIHNRLSEVDLQKLQKDIQTALREDVKTFRLRDAVSGLPPATKGRQYRVDLSYTVPLDIKDLHGNIIYPKGHKLNPLKVLSDQGISYPFMLLVINGEREAELDWFTRSRFDNERVKILITDGYPYQLGERLKRPVYHLTAAIKERFQIMETPSLVYWPMKSDYLAVRTIPVAEPEPKAEGNAERKE